MSLADGPAVEARDLRKTYVTARGEVPAVRGVDLDVPHGEFFGLLGPNGAGKSTTIGMLTTLTVPSAGVARIAGADVVRDPVAAKLRIGVASQNNTLDRQLTVAENLEFRGRFFGMRGRQARARAAEMLDMFGLTARSRAMVYELSGGQVRRLMVARALMHAPPVLVLDEPTAGIDPQARFNLWQVLRRLHAEGQTLVLTTHHLEEAEELCERVAIIDHGRVLICDSVPGLLDVTGQPDLENVFLELTGREYRE